MMKLITGALLLCCLASHCSDAAPKPGVYILPEKHGFVPVYIRHGNTPLSEINSYLATAFHENVDVKPIDFPVEINSSSSEESLESIEKKKIKIAKLKNKDDTSESIESSEEILNADFIQLKPKQKAKKPIKTISIYKY